MTGSEATAEPEPFAPVLERNIATLLARRRLETEHATRADRLAGSISRFAGSTPFVHLHLAVHGAWIVVTWGGRRQRASIRGAGGRKGAVGADRADGRPPARVDVVSGG